jgi:hypothetical protein
MASYTDNRFIKTALNFFGIVPGKKKQGNVLSSNKDLFPAEKNAETGKAAPIDMPSDIQRYYDYWLHSCHDSAATLKNRLSRYKDLTYMYYNNAIISRAIELYADETVQYDSQSQPLVVNAKEKKCISYINDFFETIGINRNSLREIARSLALYGDAFAINSLKTGIGYTSSLNVDVTTIKDRLEFNAISAKKEYARYQGMQQVQSMDARLKQLAKNIEDAGSDSDTSKYFKSYLFGFQIEDDLFLPPWAVSHFRLQSSQTEFYPFGRPLLINAISPFRQFKAAENLMALARAANFPKEHFAIKVSDEMTSAEKWMAINEARQEYQNLSKDEGSKEDFAVGGQIWTPQDLLEYKLINPDIKLSDIADMEMLRDDIIVATGIPKGYITSDRGSIFGQSGQALLQQYKPFGRAVLTIQNAILEQLIQMVKLQFIISGDYPEDTEFELSMAFPIVEDPSDRIRAKNETLQLAKAVLDSLATTLGINGKLPTEVVKDVFQKYSFLDFSDIDDWIKQITDENAKLSEDNSKKFNRLNEGLIKEAYFSSKKLLNLKDSTSNGRHIVMSNTSNEIASGVRETWKMGITKKKKL